MKTKQTIQSVERATEILLYIRNLPHSDGATLQELSDHFGLSRSSVFRLLDTLSQYDLVEKNANGSAYKLGWGLWSLGNTVPQQHRIQRNQYTEDFKKLSVTYNKSVNVGLLNEYKVIVLDKFDAPVRRVSTVHVGGTMDLYCTAIGKLYLTEFQENELDTYFDTVHPVAQTAQTITTAEEMRVELRTIKEQGYAVDNEEFFQSMRCVAYPIFGYDGRIAAAVSVTGIADEMTGETFAAIRYDLSRICHRLSIELGYR